MIESGKIIGLGAAGARQDYDVRLDAEGRIAVPGFIDLHIQGGGGNDVLDGSLESGRSRKRTLR